MHTREAFEQLAPIYSQGSFSQEYQKAREFYFAKVGKLFEDDPFFESRINAFLEWYLIDRIYYPLGVPLVRRQRLMSSTEISSEHSEALRSLEKSRHSVFVVKSVGSTFIKLQDLLSEKLQEVKKKPEYISLEEGDVIDGRVLHHRDDTLITGSFWHHPKEAAALIIRAIQDKVKSEELSEEEFLFRVAYMRWKREHFPHVPIDQVYDFQTPHKGLEHAQAN